VSIQDFQKLKNANPEESKNLSSPTKDKGKKTSVPKSEENYFAALYS
jgi:hypothetical protein